MTMKKRPEEQPVRVAIPMSPNARAELTAIAKKYKMSVAEFVRDSVNEGLVQAGDKPIDFGVRDWRKRG